MKPTRANLKMIIREVVLRWIKFNNKTYDNNFIEKIIDATMVEVYDDFILYCAKTCQITSS